MKNNSLTIRNHLTHFHFLNVSFLSEFHRPTHGCYGDEIRFHTFPLDLRSNNFGQEVRLEIRSLRFIPTAAMGTSYLRNS